MTAMPEYDWRSLAHASRHVIGRYVETTVEVQWRGPLVDGEVVELVASGYVTLAAPPMAAAGEPVAVVCPGWGDDVDDLKMRWPSGLEYTTTLRPEDTRRVEAALIAAARRMRDADDV